MSSAISAWRESNEEKDASEVILTAAIMALYFNESC
jgi:hypothetical protein